MIKVINLSKSFGLQKIFDDISFSVNEGERIGLTGRNGHGKTTLLKMITGEEHPDSGEIVIPKNYTIGYVTQHLRFTKATIVEEGCLGLPDHMKDDRWRVEKILSGLGFGSQDMLRGPGEFSGGFQVRLNLTKVLAGEPGMLLLDEPTNFLDIVSIRWLERYLCSLKSELILVTHDRSFMDRVTTHTIGIHRAKVRKIEGGTGKLYEQILKEEEIYEKTRINDQKKRKEVELFISRFKAKARLAGLVQSRVKALEKKGSLEKLEKIRTLDFNFSYQPTQAKLPMNISELSFAYGDTSALLIDKLSLPIRKNDRICVIGKNGKGKTTLLRLLAGELMPVSGEVVTHPGTVCGYFAQTNTIRLNDLKTVEDEIAVAGCEKQKARDICGAMMFEGDDALKKISVLSGGEKSRVLFGKILAAPSNLLLLDEPTNHLDMESSDALLAAVDDFDGAVVIVTHNEMFLHSLATRFIVFQNGGAFVFEGTYQDFLDRIGWEDEKDTQVKNENSGHIVRPPAGKKDLRRIRAGILTRRSRELKPLEQKIAEIENSIISLEKTLSVIHNEIIAASGSGNGEKIAVLSKQAHDSSAEIESLYNALDALTRDHESRTKRFEEEIQLP